MLTVKNSCWAIRSPMNCPRAASTPVKTRTRPLATLPASRSMSIPNRCDFSCSNLSSNGTAKISKAWSSWWRSRASAPPITFRPPDPGSSTADIWTTSPTTCWSQPSTLRTEKWTQYDFFFSLIYVLLRKKKNIWKYFFFFTKLKNVMK